MKPNQLVERVKILNNKPNDIVAVGDILKISE